VGVEEMVEIIFKVLALTVTCGMIVAWCKTKI